MKIPQCAYCSIKVTEKQLRIMAGGDSDRVDIHVPLCKRCYYSRYGIDLGVGDNWHLHPWKELEIIR